jgi:hypothetical protein
MSQLDLAIAADTTARHVSFVETGRSRQGRALVLRIGDALRVPLPERNALLAAAGFAPAFPAHDLGSQAMEPVDRVLEAVLRATTRPSGIPVRHWSWRGCRIRPDPSSADVSATRQFTSCRHPRRVLEV